MTDKYREFSSYNGLDRVVMWGGIPLLASVALMFAALILLYLGNKFFGLVGFLFPVLLLPFYFFLRMITETDDRAFSILRLELYYRMKRVAYDNFGNTLTFLPDAYFRQKSIKEYFDNGNI